MESSIRLSSYFFQQILNCFITQLLFVLADLYENTHSVYKQLIIFGQALCLLKLENHLRSQAA